MHKVVQMGAMTLAQAQALYDAWYAASLAVAQGQSYSIGGRSLTRVNAEEIRQQLEHWAARVDQLTAGRAGIRVQRMVPRDL